MTPEQRKADIVESRGHQYAIIQYYQHIAGDYDRARGVAEKKLATAQTALAEIIARYENGPSRIAECKRKLIDLDKQEHKLVRQPKLDKLAYLRAQIAQLETE